MSFGGNPDLAFRPLGPLSQLLHLGMLLANAIQHWQIVGIEYAGLSTEVAQNPFGLQSKLAAVGLRA